MKWYRFDNVGYLYANTATRDWSSVFRLSAVLYDRVNSSVLQKALDNVLPLFATFDTVLQKGFFWHYLQRSQTKLIIKRDTNWPCRPIDVYREPLIRVLYNEYRIAVEMFHGVSDGGGGWIFFKTLLRQYLLLMGISFMDNDGCFNASCGTVDCYQDIVNFDKGFVSLYTPPAYKINTTLAQGYYLTHGQMSVTQLRQTATKYNCKVGQLLTSVVAYGIYKHKIEFGKTDRPIVLNISVDLRNIFGYNTLRNFFACYLVQLSNDTHTFDTILRQVMQKHIAVDRDYLIKTVNTNIKTQNKLINKIVPLSIKRCLINIGYWLFGERLATVSISNYGVTKVPRQMSQYIDRLESANGVAKANRLIEVSVVTLQDKVVLTVCSKGQESHIERLIFATFAQLGIDVIVDSNRYTGSRWQM